MVVALETVQRDAAEADCSEAKHLHHMIVHGVLHLLGFDHETSDLDAEQMEALEAEILATFGIENPYLEILR